MYEFESSIESYILNYVEKCLLWAVSLLSTNVDNISQIYNIWIKAKDFTIKYHLLLVMFMIFLIIIKIKTLSNALKASHFITVLALDAYLKENNKKIEDCCVSDTVVFCRKYIKEHAETQQKTNNASYLRCIMSLLKYDLLDGIIRKHIENYNPINFNEVN